MRTSLGLSMAVSVLAAAAVVAPPPAPAGPPDSLPAVAGGVRPGPPVLYAEPPAAPQLENRHPAFVAPPLLVMGAEAYRGHEYLYQDWLYDDNGSDSGANDAGGSDTGGDFDYPTDRARYGGNAADLVEVRIAARGDDVVYRFTLNTLLVADSTIVTLAFDTDRDPGTGSSVLPRDPGLPLAGTDEVITVWGTGAEHSHLGAVGRVTTPLAATADLEANQLTVVVPRSVSDPVGRWDGVVLAGLRDPDTGGWLRPTATASPTRPAGAGPLDPQPAGVFNVGFRLDERPTGISAQPDSKQALALRLKDVSGFRRTIDFSRLVPGTDTSTVPSSGTIGRIFASRAGLGEGKDYTTTPELLGQLQPYSLYVPSTYRPGHPAGFTLNLHSLGEHHWQYNGTTGIRQMGEERGSLVATCECRGEDGWYQNEAEFDVFEMWNDVARHYSLDPDRAAISGYSMGGYATYRLATLYPDLFGRAFSIVGPPADGVWLPPLPASGGTHTNTNVWLENARNVPFLNLVGGIDELVPVAGTRAQNMGAPELGIRGFEQLGYRYRYVVYPTADHFALAALSYDVPYAAAWLGSAEVDRNPAHVTFTYAPATDDPSFGLVHDHAYWVSGIRLADPAVGSPIAKATVDAFSHAWGRADPPSVGGQTAGHGPLPYVESFRTWGPAPVIPAENKLTLELDNVGHVDIHLGRAGLDLGRPLTLVVTASAPGTVRLLGAGTTSVTVAPGTSTIVVPPRES